MDLDNFERVDSNGIEILSEFAVNASVTCMDGFESVPGKLAVGTSEGQIGIYQVRI